MSDPFDAASGAGRPLVLVGLMSGTSHDGISAAVVRFHPGVRDDRPRPELLAFTQQAYDDDFRARLLHAIANPTHPGDYARLDFELGERLGAAAVTAIAESGLGRTDIDAVASHGHTVWHDAPRATWQFGQPAAIAERTGRPVIADFRTRDVAAGGQGAPLVPIADALLFAGADRRALQNIGGIGNVTVVPPGGGVVGTRAFDTGPGVGVVDAVVRTLRPELPYDVDGTLALQGRAIDPVVAQALAHPYFSAPPPKSTGRELFTPAYVGEFIASCRAAEQTCRDEDVVATAVELTARSIALAFERFIPEPVADLVLSGGGARNPALVQRVVALMAPRAVRQFDDLFFDGDAKEAVAFAFLGWLHLRGLPGNVPSCTGARGPRVLGTLTPA
ncbi:MAG: anhydro-N-acetylmuramic acid kinase [Gemmatimonadaceae bacterium]|nr:anhydro-N-acetylmuramic acid kinase [Gemmatimonadaceae bacterium]